jgi:hypothetical protein
VARTTEPSLAHPIVQTSYRRLRPLANSEGSPRVARRLGVYGGDVRRVLVAMALLGVLSGCGTQKVLHHSSAITSSSVTVASTSVPSTSVVPDTVAPTSDTSPTPPSSVFYLQPSADTSTLISYDWSGHQVGSLHTAIPILCCALSQSPDGSRLFYGANILDGQGHLLGTTQVPGTWAEDNRHWCVDVSESTPQPFAKGVLEVVGTQSGDVRRIAEVGGSEPHGGSSVASCDLKAETAVVVQSAMGVVGAVDAVNLSTGQVTRTLPSGPSDPCSLPLVVSTDGSMVAGNLPPQQGPPVPRATGGIVCSLLTHQIVGHFDGQPEALSRTGRLVVIQVTSPNDSALEVVDWRTHTVLLRIPTSPSSGPWVSALDEPGGDGLALTVTTHTLLGTGAADGWLVRPGTSPVHLASNVSQGVE